MYTPFTSIKNHKTYFIVLLFSVLFFIRKAIQYALLESYIPTLIILVIFGLISLSLLLKKKVKQTLRFWSILLIIWGTIRILLFLANTFLKEISESHIYRQLFGFTGVIISILFLFIGVFLFRNSKKLS